MFTVFIWLTEKAIALLATCFHAGFLLGLFFHHEDGRDMLLRKVGWLSTVYTALYLRRQNFSQYSTFGSRLRRDIFPPSTWLNLTKSVYKQDLEGDIRTRMFLIVGNYKIDQMVSNGISRS
jgi:hypothetical protein